MDWRCDGNYGRGNDGRWADVAQAAAMLSGVMRFLLIRVGCRLRAERGAEDEQDQHEPPN